MGPRPWAWGHGLVAMASPSLGACPQVSFSLCCPRCWKSVHDFKYIRFHDGCARSVKSRKAVENRLTVQYAARGGQRLSACHCNECDIGPATGVRGVACGFDWDWELDGPTGGSMLDLRSSRITPRRPGLEAPAVLLTAVPPRPQRTTRLRRQPEILEFKGQRALSGTRRSY